MSFDNIRYLEFLYKIGQWVKEEQKDISAQSAIKLLSYIEVLLVSIDPLKKEEVYDRLNKITDWDFK